MPRSKHDGRPTTSAWSRSPRRAILFRRSPAVLELTAVGVCALALDKHAAQDLSGSCLGNGVNKLQTAHLFVRGHALRDVGHDLLWFDACFLLPVLFLEHDKGFGHLSSLLVRAGDHCGVGDGGM